MQEFEWPAIVWPIAYNARPDSFQCEGAETRRRVRGLPKDRYKFLLKCDNSFLLRIFLTLLDEGAIPHPFTERKQAWQKTSKRCHEGLSRCELFICKSSTPHTIILKYNSFPFCYIRYPALCESTLHEIVSWELESGVNYVLRRYFLCAEEIF